MSNFVLLAFSKRVNTRPDCIRPETTVTGNVILSLPSITIDKFNIPTLENIETLMVRKVSGYQRMFRGQIAITEEFETTRKELKTKRSAVLKFWRNKETYTINFPWFFNNSMVDQALFGMVKANRGGLKYHILPSKVTRVIDGTETAWGKVWLPQTPIISNNTEKSGGQIGITTFVSSTKQRRKGKIL